MKNIIEQLNKAFDNRVRLGIMSILLVNEEVDFNEMKERLDLTDGNLASHISALEKLDYVLVKKEFVGKKTKTTYQVSILGKKAFQDHIKALEKLLHKK
ncbi:MAG: transcriptional regulator [Bacteroidota bacterium]